MRIATAQPSEHIAALEFLFRHRPSADADDRVRAALDMLDAAGDAVRLIVASDAGRLVGATLAEVVPGGTGVVWPPVAPGRNSVEDALRSEALDWLKLCGVKLVQVILPAEDLPLAGALLRGGFRRPTQLIYLGAVPYSAGDDGKFEPFGRSPAGLFHETLLRSTEGGRDFPELDGLRTPDEVIDGYSCGADPRRWWLRRDAGSPVGVLLLTETEPRAWDLSYVGVVPEARRRGHGQALVEKALTEAHAAGADSLTVCVDSRNEPALTLYRRAGFDEFERRDVFLYLW